MNNNPEYGDQPLDLDALRREQDAYEESKRNEEEEARRQAEAAELERQQLQSSLADMRALTSERAALGTELRESGYEEGLNQERAERIAAYETDLSRIGDDLQTLEARYADDLAALQGIVAMIEGKETISPVVQAHLRMAREQVDAANSKRDALREAQTATAEKAGAEADLYQKHELLLHGVSEIEERIGGLTRIPEVMETIRDEAEKEHILREAFVKEAGGLLMSTGRQTESAPPEAERLKFVNLVLQQFISEELKAAGTDSIGSLDIQGIIMGLKTDKNFWNIARGNTVIGPDYGRTEWLGAPVEEHVSGVLKGLALRSLLDSRIYGQGAPENQIAPMLVRASSGIDTMVGTTAEEGPVYERIHKALLDHLDVLNTVKAASEGSTVGLNYYPLVSGRDMQRVPSAWADPVGSMMRSGFTTRSGGPLIPKEWRDDPEGEGREREAEKVYQERLEATRRSLLEYMEKAIAEKQERKERIAASIEELRKLLPRAERVDEWRVRSHEIGDDLRTLNTTQENWERDVARLQTQKSDLQRELDATALYNIPARRRIARSLTDLEQNIIRLQRELVERKEDIDMLTSQLEAIEDYSRKDLTKLSVSQRIQDFKRENDILTYEIERLEGDATKVRDMLGEKK